MIQLARRIIAKAILGVVRPDIQEAAGALQLCAGQISSVEAAVHAVRCLFETEAILLADVHNVFNSLNRHPCRTHCSPTSPPPPGYGLN